MKVGIIMGSKSDLDTMKKHLPYLMNLTFL